MNTKCIRTVGSSKFNTYLGNHRTFKNVMMVIKSNNRTVKNEWKKDMTTMELIDNSISVINCSVTVVVPVYMRSRTAVGRPGVGI